MKKTGMCCYIAVCLLLCILPFAGMAVYGTDATTENRTLAKLPSAVKEERLNTDYFEELGVWFEDHFSFREELVTVDALICSRLFSVSNVDTVLTGTDGWLYYTDTLDDYLGANTMNPRQVFNVANNLALLGKYVAERGAQFVFTVAPNKNSLYGEHMPYYAGSAVGEKKNMDLLEPALARAGVSYVDLFSAFERTDETLYLKRDSHWNAKGAVLAYNTIFDALLAEHETYETVDVVREKKEIGDLNRMLYPLAAEPEWNFYYQSEKHWDYTTQPHDVEAAWIQTACETGEGSLLMFRDSFGNTLLPLMAERFAEGAFSKGVPYLIGSYMDECRPDVVIVEKVERNLDEYLTAPPVMQGPQVDMEAAAMDVSARLEPSALTEPDADADTGLCANELMEDTTYMSFTGDLGGMGLGEDAKIFLRLRGENGEADTVYEAFTVSAEQSDYGFVLYLKKETVADLADSGKITVDVLIQEDDGFRTVDTRTLDVQTQP